MRRWRFEVYGPEVRHGTLSELSSPFDRAWGCQGCVTIRAWTKRGAGVKALRWYERVRGGSLVTQLVLLDR